MCAGTHSINEGIPILLQARMIDAAFVNYHITDCGMRWIKVQNYIKEKRNLTFIRSLKKLSPLTHTLGFHPLSSISWASLIVLSINLLNSLLRWAWIPCPVSGNWTSSASGMAALSRNELLMRTRWSSSPVTIVTLGICAEMRDSRSGWTWCVRPAAIWEKWPINGCLRARVARRMNSYLGRMGGELARTDDGAWALACLPLIRFGNSSVPSGHPLLSRKAIWQCTPSAWRSALSFQSLVWTSVWRETAFRIPEGDCSMGSRPVWLRLGRARLCVGVFCMLALGRRSRG